MIRLLRENTIKMDTLKTLVLLMQEKGGKQLFLINLKSEGL